MENNIHQKEILKYLEHPIEITCFETIDSTNTEARRHFEQGERNIHLYFANAQTAGRGRHGHDFYSPKEGFYFSLLLPVDNCLEMPMYTILAAVSSMEAIKEVSDIQTEIKWVNDLYYNRKKVSGILCEALHEADSGKTCAVIIGIGINCEKQEFPDDIKDIAGDLGGNIDRNRLAALLCNRILYWCDQSQTDLMRIYKKHSLVLHKTVTWNENGTLYEGLVTDINDQGNLIVQSNDAIHCLSSGEISLSSW